MDVKLKSLLQFLVIVTTPKKYERCPDFIEGMWPRSPDAFSNERVEGLLERVIATQDVMLTKVPKRRRDDANLFAYDLVTEQVVGYNVNNWSVEHVHPLQLGELPHGLTSIVRYTEGKPYVSCLMVSGPSDDWDQPGSVIWSWRGFCFGGQVIQPMFWQCRIVRQAWLRQLDSLCHSGRRSEAVPSVEDPPAMKMVGRLRRELATLRGQGRWSQALERKSSSFIKELEALVMRESPSSLD